jgi:hypothetical protein
LPEIVEILGAMHVLLTVARGLEEARSGFGEWAEATRCFAIRFVGCRALRQELLGAEREVQPDLVFDLSLPAIATTKRQTKRATDAGSNHVAAVAGAPLLDAVRMLVTVPAY